MNFYKISQYLHYRRHATRPAGLHSPFLYHLFYDQLADKQYNRALTPLLNYIRSCAHDTAAVTLTDYGAGSQASKAATRSIRSITHSTRRSTWQYRWLYALAKHLSFSRVLELGTSLGFSTAALALGMPGGQVHTCEGDPTLATYAQEHLLAMGLTHATVHTGRFADQLPILTATHAPFDAILLDGHHTETATLSYFNQLLPHCSEQAVIWVDDIYWSPGMTNAWRTLTAHEAVTVHVDLYYFGLLFLRRAKAKEGIILRP